MIKFETIKFHQTEKFQ